MTDRRHRTYAEIRDRRERTPEEQAFDCRVDRIVDWWVSAWHENPHLRGTAYLDPLQWGDPRWAKVSRDARQRRADPPPDAAVRAAVIAEIDAIVSDSMERRRSA
jgi:hypothetical protein